MPLKEVLDILDRIQKEEINIAKLAKETGIPPGRIYKWKDRGSKITLEDALELQKWALNGLDNSTQKPNSKQRDLRPGQSNELILEAIREVAAAVKKIQQRIQEVYPEGKDNLLAVSKAIRNKDSAGGKGKAGKQK